MVRTARHSLLASAWFAAWALGAASLLFLVPAARRGADAIVLFIVLPTLAGACAGAVCGWRILARARQMRAARAALLGLVTTGVAHAIFSVLFVLVYSVLGTSEIRLGPATAATFVLGSLAAGALLAPVGVLSGLVARSIFSRR